jgi:hypothetical protein
VSESDKLPQDTELNRLYRASRYEAPNEALDQAVLAEARKVTARYRKRWILPLSSAALILLGVGLSLPLIDLKEDIYQPRLPLPASVEQTDSRPKGESVLSKPAPPQAPAAASDGFKPRSMAEPVPQFEMASPPVMEYRARERSQALGPERKRKQQASEAKLQSADSGISDLPPEQWLLEIEAMIEAGRDQAAKRALNGFIKVYPDYPLPKSLRTWQAEQ